MVVSIQYLRGFAALAVAITHLYPMFFKSENPFEGGSAGVDLFFVISGFIMWHIAQAKDGDPIGFFMHRLIRVAPPYWLVTMIVAVSATLKPNLFPLDHPTLDHVVLSIAFIPHGEGDVGKPLVSQGWTLNYEMFFYIIFAAALLLPARFRLLALSGTMTSLVAVGVFTTTDSQVLTVVTSDLLLEFLGGVVIAVAYRKARTAPVSVALCGVLLGTVILAIMPHLVANNPDFEVLRSIRLGVPAAVVVYCMVSLEWHGLFGRNRILLALGEVSFALYLVHFLSASFYLIVAPHLGLPIEGSLAFMLALSLAIGSAFAFFRVAEDPLREFLLAQIRRLRNPVAHTTGRTPVPLNQ